MRLGDTVSFCLSGDPAKFRFCSRPPMPGRHVHFSFFRKKDAKKSPTPNPELRICTLQPAFKIRKKNMAKTVKPVLESRADKGSTFGDPLEQLTQRLSWVLKLKQKHTESDRLPKDGVTLHAFLHEAPHFQQAAVRGALCGC